ncbi:peptide chain release factor N(5)-glutamine methyltransferase [Lapidilactobacillus wuchangensis]|uniref:peptide chain release factor N(5)-glutamine methyltransferase n=1 Tax=Lapidilactobacillus wuchangensis TaxID=2486001 RepID=UPI000F799700|nr:peptide chain release factor N(5)-glutamine methyltransferase [Lapidilactobacillus wuchangensis]
MTRPTYYKALNWAFLLLKEKNLDEQAAEYLLLERQKWTKTDLIFHEREIMVPAVWQQFQTDVQELLTGRPAQYILGQAWFYDLQLQVTPATLIPRPETEFLVAWLLENVPTSTTPKILDLGTGSGAIALAIKHELPNSEVWATDLSEAALQVAQANAQRLALPIHFAQGDLLQAVAGEKFDLIISNPPYISHDEEAVMDYSVKHFEPQLALYADNRGLALYQQLAQTVAAHLKTGGQLFLEFGYQQAPAIREIYQQALPTATITIKKDLAGWPRMARIQLPD